MHYLCPNSTARGVGVTNQAPPCIENPETSYNKSKKEQRAAGPGAGTAEPEHQEGTGGGYGDGDGDRSSVLRAQHGIYTQVWIICAEYGSNI